MWEKFAKKIFFGQAKWHSRAIYRRAFFMKVREKTIYGGHYGKCQQKPQKQRIFIAVQYP
jgi:hypothetical protein